MSTTKVDIGKAQIVYSDDKGELRVEKIDGKKVLTAKDPKGLLQFSGPADQVLSRYFRAHPQLGQRDRAFVAESGFAVLRRRRSLEAISGSAEPRALLAAALMRVLGFSGRALEGVVDAALAEVDADFIGKIDFSIRGAKSPLDTTDPVRGMDIVLRGRTSRVASTSLMVSATACP